MSPYLDATKVTLPRHGDGDEPTNDDVAGKVSLVRKQFGHLVLGLIGISPTRIRTKR